LIGFRPPGPSRESLQPEIKRTHTERSRRETTRLVSSPRKELAKLHSKTKSSREQQKRKKRRARWHKIVYRESSSCFIASIQLPVQLRPELLEAVDLRKACARCLHCCDAIAFAVTGAPLWLPVRLEWPLLRAQLKGSALACRARRAHALHRRTKGPARVAGSVGESVGPLCVCACVRKKNEGGWVYGVQSSQVLNQ
jgi:hypothetical protein